MLYVESLNLSLHEMMADSQNVVLIGEDLMDPYGGAFKVSKGLSTNFPLQVLSTPISEHAIVGAAIGMSLRGLTPIVEIMFGDFITLCVDQIVNHAAKYHWMYNELVSVPIVIRIPMGGGRGYGPTHSQSLESLFMSVSGLKICAPSIFHDPGYFLKQSVLHEKLPILFIEDKISYSKNLQIDQDTMAANLQRKTLSLDGINETVLISPYMDENADVLIITYGGMTEMAANSALKLFIEYEILVHVISFSMIRPIPIDDALFFASQTGRIIVLEEGNTIGGWGSEVASQLQEKAFFSLLKPIQRLGALDTPIPSASLLERETLPSEEKLIKLVRNLMQ